MGDCKNSQGWGEDLGGMGNECDPGEWYEIPTESIKISQK